ncbi:MAG: hypothetical protein RR361_04640 [Anaerovorax sp.]
MRNCSDIRPQPVEINILTDGTAEINFCENITERALGLWEFDYYKLITDYKEDLEIVVFLFYDLFLIHAKKQTMEGGD